MVNSTANMRAFDTTVDLSIDLLDRMGSFNEEIMERVSYMEDKYLDSLVSNDDYSSGMVFIETILNIQLLTSTCMKNYYNRAGHSQGRTAGLKIMILILFKSYK